MQMDKNKIDRRQFLFHSVFYASTVSKNIKNPVPVQQERKIKKICVNANNGRIIFQEDADVVCPPASLVKLMLMYLVAIRIQKNEKKLEDEIVVKKTIYPKNNSDILLSPDKKYSLNYLMEAIAVISSNTSATAVAESLWGSQEKCIEEMNLTAQKLGMKNTQYFTVNGYPKKSGNDLDKTTAKDLAILAMHCCKVPLIFSWTSKKKLLIKEGNIERDNTNDLLFLYTGCDGFKTGYTRLAGHCLIATAKRANSRVIAVVLGAEKSGERFRIAMNLMDIGFYEMG